MVIQKTARKFEALVISVRRSRQCGAANPASFNKSRGGDDEDYDVCDATKSSAAWLANLHARKYR